MGWFNEEAIQEILKIPKEVRVIGLTPLGFSDYTPKPQQRLALEEIVFEEKYGEPYKKKHIKILKRDLDFSIWEHPFSRFSDTI